MMTRTIFFRLFTGEPTRPIREEERRRIRRGRVRGAPRPLRVQFCQEVCALRLRHRQWNLLGRSSLLLTTAMSLCDRLFFDLLLYF